MRLTVPGAILLLGEYAVLEENGVGLAMAVERRVRISIDPSPDLAIHSTWPGGAAAWTRAEGALAAGGPLSLLSTAVETVEEWLRDARQGKGLGQASIRVDSSALFGPDGRKAGLGSSAAVAAGLVAALLHCAGARGSSLEEAAPRLALRAHRKAQGGAGSGYDVYCSFHGGLGLFHGGAIPIWEPRRLSWDLAVYLFPGRAPLRTPEAILAYSRWKQANPRAALRFLEGSNKAVMDFVSARSMSEVQARFAACRELALELGDAIGVPARIKAPAGFDPAWCKALGAGDELGACLLPGAASLPAQEPTWRAVEPVWRAEPSNEGVVWKP